MDRIVAQWNDPNRPQADFVLDDDSDINDYVRAFTITACYATDFQVRATQEQKALADTLGLAILTSATDRFGQDQAIQIAAATTIAAGIYARLNGQDRSELLDDYGIPLDEIF